MTSEIRVNKLQNRVGLGTVEYTNTGIVVSGIVTCTELSGLTALNIAGVGTANTLDINGDIDVDGHTNLDNVSIAGVVTATTGVRISANGDLRFANGTWSGEVAGKIQQNSNKLYIQSGSNGTQIRRADGQSSWEWQTNGHFLPGLNSNVNIGESSKRVLNIYTDNLDVDSHTNLDNVSIAGFTTFAQNINVTGSVTGTSLVLNAGAPTIFLNDTDANSDFSIQCNGGLLKFMDTTNSYAIRLSINSSGNVSIAKDLDVDGHTNLDNVSIAGVSTVYGHGAFGSTVDINGDLAISDTIKHIGDADTKIRFPAADQISFETSGTEYLKLHRYSSVNFVEVGASVALSLANNGSGNRYIVIGDGNASSTGALKLQAGGGSTGWGGGITMYSHANTTNAGGVYIGKSLNSSGAIIFGNGGTSPTNEYLRIDSSGNISINNAATPPSSNGQLGKRLGIKSTLNNIIVGETTNSGNSGLILESRVTGRSGNARCSQINLGNGTLQFYTAASGADVTERLEITSTGQIRIDQATSANNGIRMRPSGWNYDFRFGAVSSSGGSIWLGQNYDPTAGTRDSSSYGTNYLRFTTQGEIMLGTGAINSNPTERLKITNAGNVGINEDNPQTTLNVRGCISTGRNVAREVGTIIDISSSYSGGRNGVSVINGIKNYEENPNADWITANGQRVNANLTIDLGAQYTCDRFVIYNQNEYTNNVREVKHFTLEGSNDKSSWTTLLDDECGASYAQEPNPGFSFRIPASFLDDDEGATYRYWRFTMKDYHGSTTLGGVMELELYEVDSNNTTISEISTHHLSAQDITAQTIYHDLPAFFACKTSSLSISNQTNTVLAFTTDQGPGFDTHGYWNNSNYKFIPKIPGYYQINMCCSVSYGALQAGQIWIYKNGSAYAISQLYLNGGESYDDIALTISALVHLDGQNDYLEARAWRNGGNGGLGSGFYDQHISGYLVRHAGYRRHGDGV